MAAPLARATERRSLALAGLIGALLGAGLTSQALPRLGSPLWVAPAFIVITLAGAALALPALRRLVLPALAAMPPLRRWAWIAACLAAGVLLVWLVPIYPYPKPQTFRIIATGEKNPASKSSEVWLNQISVLGRAQAVPLRDCQGDWSPTPPELLVSQADEQPGSLTCTVGALDDIDLQFGAHDYSGKVRVKYGDQSVVVDLYAPSGTVRDVTLAIAPAGRDRLLAALLFAADASVAAFLLLVFMLAAVAVPAERSALPRPKIAWPVYSLVMAAAWLACLLAYWPGTLTPDSVDQFTQAATGIYNNWHPAFHTFLIALTTRISFSPAPLVILQILALAALLGNGLAWFERRGQPWWLCLGVALFLALSPGLALIMITPWKDVAYTIALVGINLLILHLLERQDRPVSAWVWAALALASICAALLRQNGPAAAAGTLLLLAVALRRHRRPLLMVLGVAVGLSLLIFGPVYDAFHVNKIFLVDRQRVDVYTSMMLIQPVYLLRYHQLAGTPLQPVEQAFLEQVFPIDDDSKIALLGLRSHDLLGYAADVTWRAPLVSLDYLRTKAAFVFQVLRPSGVRLEYAALGVSENELGIRSAPRLPGLQPRIERLAALTQRPELDWLFWRNAFWMYFLLAAGVAAALRLKDWKVLLALLPALTNALPLALFNGGHIARYIFPTLALGPLLGVGLLFFKPEAPPAAPDAGPADEDAGTALTAGPALTAGR